MMQYHKPVKLFFRCLALLFMLALAACDAGIGQQGATPVSSSTPYLGNGSPKGPGSVALTATARATPVVVNCQLPTAMVPGTQGWHTYTDATYPFHFAFPPGWKVGQTVITSADGSYSSYEVMILPPTGHSPVTEYSGMVEPEYVSVSIVLTGPANAFSSEPPWIPETTPILLSHVSTKLSYRFSPECGELNLATDPVTFGQHPYFFYLESRDQADKTKDSQIFLGIVQSFTYTGS